MISTKICDLTHWSNEDSITNIISLADTMKYFRVTYDSDDKLVLSVHMRNKLIQFKQMNNKLYAMNPEYSKQLFTKK